MSKKNRQKSYMIIIIYHSNDLIHVVIIELYREKTWCKFKDKPQGKVKKKKVLI